MVKFAAAVRAAWVAAATFALCAHAADLALPLSAAPADLHLQIRPVWDGPERRLDVRVTFDAAGRERTPLALPTHWANATEMHRGVRNLRALTRGARIEVTDDPAHRTVLHSPQGAVKIAYEVVEINQDGVDYRRFYLPLLRNEFAHFFGHGIWALPAWNDRQTVKLRIDVSGLPKHWVAVSSFGAQRAGRTTVSWRSNTLPLAAVRHSLYVFGDFRLHRADIKGRPVWIAIRGKFRFDDRIFFDRSAALLRTHRDFFRDHSFPHLLLTLIPTRHQSGSYGGTSVFQAFAMHVSADFEVPGPIFEHLIAHEHLHTWLPSRFGAMGKDEALRYWFSEGFTNFLTHRLLLRSGQWSLADYARTLNGVVRRLELSVARNRDNQAILDLFFKDRDIGALPYQRGELLALRWDSELRAHGRSLPEMLRELTRPSAGTRRSSDKSTLATDRLLTAMSLALRDVQSDVTRLIETGESFDYSEDLLGPCFTMQPTTYTRFELGFDHQGSMKERRVIGLVPGSAAERAGLRDGDNLRSWSIQFDDPMHDAQLSVERDGIVLAINYLPASNATVAGVEYVQRPGADSDPACRAWVMLQRPSTRR